MDAEGKLSGDPCLLTDRPCSFSGLSGIGEIKLLEAVRQFLEANLGLTGPLELVAAGLGVVGGLWTVGKIGLELKAKWSARSIGRDRYAEPPLTIEEADRRIQDDPKDLRHYLSRAELLSSQGHHLEALGAIDKALAIRETPEAIETRSRINLEAGNFADAIADAEHAVQLGTSKTECALTIGHALRSMGDFQAAEKQADKMLELGEVSEKLYWLRALARIQQNKLQEALPDVLKVIRADESAPEPRIMAASLYLDLGDEPKAIVQYEKAIELGEPNADLYAELGFAYSMAGDKESAMALYHQALALDPSHDGATKGLEAVKRSRVAAIAHAALSNVMRKVSWN